jgi:hypothetical protein
MLAAIAAAAVGTTAAYIARQVLAAVGDTILQDSSSTAAVAAMAIAAAVAQPRSYLQVSSTTGVFICSGWTAVAAPVIQGSSRGTLTGVSNCRASLAGLKRHNATAVAQLPAAAVPAQQQCQHSSKSSSNRGLQWRLQSCRRTAAAQRQWRWQQQGQRPLWHSPAATCMREWHKTGIDSCSGGCPHSRGCALASKQQHCSSGGHRGRHSETGASAQQLWQQQRQLWRSSLATTYSGGCPHSWGCALEGSSTP